MDWMYSKEVADYLYNKFGDDFTLAVRTRTGWRLRTRGIQEI